MNQIFISHSHENIDFAENLDTRLRQEGFTVFRDTDIHAGEDWRKGIDQEIQDASALIVIMTSEAKASEYVTYEWAFALGAGVKVIPVLLKETKPKLHPRLESLQYLDFTNRNARPWDGLIELLRKEKEMRADGIPPTGRIHRYSGEWEIKTDFLKWQGLQIEGNNKVTFEGTMFLLLSDNGQRGSGTQTGQLNTSIHDWRATYQVANQVTTAKITEDGTLQISIQVLSRTRIKGEPPPPPYRDELFGMGRFDVILRPTDSFRTFTGEHKYPSGYLQDAAETYKHKGFPGTAAQ